jgi:hypothetical protein
MKRKLKGRRCELYGSTASVPAVGRRLCPRRWHAAGMAPRRYSKLYSYISVAAFTYEAPKIYFLELTEHMY